jgi:hypothetical protein
VAAEAECRTVALSNPVVSLIFKGKVAASRLPRVLRSCCL